MRSPGRLPRSRLRGERKLASFAVLSDVGRDSQPFDALPPLSKHTANCADRRTVRPDLCVGTPRSCASRAPVAAPFLRFRAISLQRKLARKDQGCEIRALAGIRSTKRRGGIRTHEAPYNAQRFSRPARLRPFSLQIDRFGILVRQFSRQFSGNSALAANLPNRVSASRVRAGFRVARSLRKRRGQEVPLLLLVPSASARSVRAAPPLCLQAAVARGSVAPLAALPPLVRGSRRRWTRSKCAPLCCSATSWTCWLTPTRAPRQGVMREQPSFAL